MLVPLAMSQLPQLSSVQQQWLGEQIFQNECNQRLECLTHWNVGEDFPSLGIGHFIWYRKNQNELFEETFPSLIESYHTSNYDIPAWLKQLEPLDSPWQNREEFLDDISSPQMEELRQFLANSMDLQLKFIVARLHASVPEILLATDAKQRAAIQRSFYQVANSYPPYGIYALIDYVHFKGTGIDERERYQNQGWGLLQVFIEMHETQQENATLESFVDSAGAILERRVRNSPPTRNEQRWIAGWKKRLSTYLPTKAK